MDGVYVEEQGELSFHPLPCLGNSDVADILLLLDECDGTTNGPTASTELGAMVSTVSVTQ